MPDAAQELTDQLRALEQRGRRARQAAGLPCSRREAAAGAARTKYKVAVRFQAISDWLPAPNSPKEATVPSAASSEQVLALVMVWSDWAGERPSERYWRDLLERAQDRHHGVLPGPVSTGPGSERASNVRAGNFIGRVAELGALDAAFASADKVVVHAVHGLGGVGKSALAARWASGRPEPVRWWITADSPAAVDAGLAALARTLNPSVAEKPTEVQSEAAMRWLDTNNGWLLVLDNVEEPGDIRPLLDRVSGGRVLITSRRATGWHLDATTIRLDTLAPSDAADLFTRVLTAGDPLDAGGVEAVCNELGHLALAVEQAASYCAETGTTPREYLGMLARWPAEMFAAGPEGSDTGRTVARIWRLTLDRLANTPLSGDILRILAWYAPDDIPRDLFVSRETPPEVTTAIGRLIAYSMITDNHDGTLSVHRLVQTLARTADPSDPHRRAADIDSARDQAAALLANAFPTDVGHPANWPRCRALIPHTLALTSRHPPEQDTLDTTHALDRAATFHEEQGAYATAIPAFDRALNSRERILGVDDPLTMAQRNNLARALERSGDLNRAISLFERDVRVKADLLGPNHRDTLTGQTNLAHAYAARGDLKRTIRLFEHVLNTRERVLGNDDPSTVAARNNLAGAYTAVGDPARAIPLHERTIQDFTRILGSDDPRTLTSRGNLAATFLNSGDSARAVQLYDQTLGDRERVLGRDHHDTLASRGDLAGAHAAAGDLDRALLLQKRTVEDMDRVFGPDHVSTVSHRNSLAEMYVAAGDLERAISVQEDALETAERTLAPSSPLLLAVISNLGTAYVDAGDLDRGISLQERAFSDAERALTAGNPQLLAIRDRLAGAYEAAGDQTRADSLLDRSRTDREPAPRNALLGTARRIWNALSPRKKDE
ncbi:FxSxx-COOH system tetratricopeptide repeat protein [Streptomyces virginiae]|uniref:FxSxx-COOH system tetratricopeptide repeat protein n=1 Tax=Streptomyces virginiae TaxID=1961 RepID=UPI0036A2BD81